MLNFCTLFDSYYFIRGMAMYESLKKHCKDFHLYIFAFDDKVYKQLNELNLEKVTVLSLNEFEDEELLRVKPTRSAGEYCWTCTSSTILYCINNFNLGSCTYLDSDIYFYSDPRILIDEMGEKSVLITEHRFHDKNPENLVYGKYCVQFVTFKNTESGMKVLTWWRDKCIEWCYNRLEDGKCGDQKYLDCWTEKFEGVHVLQNFGGGVAPWNLLSYNLLKDFNGLFVQDKKTKQKYKLVFHHFQDVKLHQKLELETYDFYKRTIPFLVFVYNPYLKHMYQIGKKHKLLDKNIKPYEIKLIKLLEKGIRIYRKKFVSYLKEGKNGIYN